MENLLDSCDATELADLVRRRQVRPRELAEAAIARIERENPRLNAVVTKLYDAALAECDALEASRADLPFAGVPFLVKDLMGEQKGVRNTAGSRALAQNIGAVDSEIVARLKRAGAIILGRTNTPEFGLLPTTEPLQFGPCRNPANPAFSAGGSSGGSAAAVAARWVPMAHGNDGGGSLRIPASCCGVFAMKPTRGRIPLGPVAGDVMGGLVVEGAITRTVRDSAALLDALSGPAAGDPYWAPPAPRPFADCLREATRPLRIAFSEDSPLGGPVHEQCRLAVRNAAAMCESLGHRVEPGAPAFDAKAFVDAFMVVWTASATSAVENICAMLKRAPGPELFDPATLTLAAMGRRHSAADCLRAFTALGRIGRQVGRWFAGVDVWMTPTLADPPAPIGFLDAAATDEGAMRDAGFRYSPFTAIANATGQPAMSMPLHRTPEEGLPVGVQFFGRLGEEGLLFALAAQVEAARGGVGRLGAGSLGA